MPSKVSLIVLLLSAFSPLALSRYTYSSDEEDDYAHLHQYNKHDSFDEYPDDYFYTEGGLHPKFITHDDISEKESFIVSSNGVVNGFPRYDAYRLYDL